MRKVALRDSISAQAFIPNVWVATHNFLQKALGTFNLLIFDHFMSTGRLSNDSGCKITMRSYSKCDCIEKIKKIPPTIIESREDDILEDIEVTFILVKVSTGRIGVILAAARSSTFLATATVSTLFEKK